MLFLRLRLQVVREIDVMLPGHIQSPPRSELPFETDTYRYITRRRPLVLLLVLVVQTRTQTRKDIWRVRLDALVVFVSRVVTEEIELRHHIAVPQLVLPHLVQLRRCLIGLELPFITRYPLTRGFHLQRPTLGELVTEVQTVRLAHIHEDMRRTVTHIVTAAALNADLA